MTISVKHAFTSAKGDGTDATLVRPSNWNAEHTITLATDKLLGRATAGTGAVEEITCTSAARSILDDATIADILTTLGVSPQTTGDIRLTIKTAASTGWVMMDDGTIGSATSGASNRANADCQNLFELIYNNVIDAYAPVLTSAGVATTRAAQGSSGTAWAANCRVTLPLTVGRALVGMGAAGGWSLGEYYGADTHALTAAELAGHTHSVTSTGSGSGSTGYVSNDHTHAVTVSGTTSGHSADHNHYVTISGNTGSMNSNWSHTHGVSGGVYGGTGSYGNFGNFDGLSAPINASAITISSANIDHTHSVSLAAWSGGASADHTHTVTSYGNTGGISANHNHSVSTSVSVSGTTDTGSGLAGTAHNIIQKSTAFNIMMKL